MNAHEVAALSVMTEDEAGMVLRAIENMALWTPEMIIELSLLGISAGEIVDYLDRDPMRLLAYLVVNNIANPLPFDAA